MTYNEQVQLFGRTAIHLADGLLNVFGREESQRIARERISRYCAGKSKTDPQLISFWSDVLKHTMTLQTSNVAESNPWELAALKSCVERLKAS